MFVELARASHVHDDCMYFNMKFVSSLNDAIDENFTHLASVTFVLLLSNNNSWGSTIHYIFPVLFVRDPDCPPFRAKSIELAHRFVLSFPREFVLLRAASPSANQTSFQLACCSLKTSFQKVRPMIKIGLLS